MPTLDTPHRLQQERHSVQWYRSTAGLSCWSTGRRSSCYNVGMSLKRIKGRWVVYERRRDGPEGFVYLSKFFLSRKDAEKERDRMSGLPQYERSSLGVGFVRNT